MKTFQPITKNIRIKVVDALRGFALLGVLLANIPYGGEPLVAHPIDDSLRFLTNLLISKKFITIFSILFGFGFYIQMIRAQQKGVAFKNYFLKRMGLLFLIGIIHCFGIWNGDIIMSYAFGGIFLLLLRNWSVKKLLLLAVLFNVILTGIVFIGNSALGWGVYNYDYNLALIHPMTNSFLEYLEINAIMAPWLNFQQDMPLTLVYTFGNMLIGMILGKIDFFKSPSRLKKTANFLIVVGFTFGLVCSYFFHQVTTGVIELDIPLLWVPFVLAAGMILQSLGYIALFVRLYQKNWGMSLLSKFRFVGKTALSNYIFQSVFYLFVFYHCTNAFQLFGKISLAATFGLALLFFIAQSIMSHLWLKNRQQGPLEYVWKKLSYKNF